MTRLFFPWKISYHLSLRRKEKNDNPEKMISLSPSGYECGAQLEARQGCVCVCVCARSRARAVGGCGWRLNPFGYSGFICKNREERWQPGLSSVPLALRTVKRLWICSHPNPPDLPCGPERPKQSWSSGQTHSWTQHAA